MLPTAFPSSPVSPEHAALIQSVIDEFMPLTCIPHPSGHEQRVSDYLVAWAQKHKLRVEQDAQYNVIIEKPASTGRESAPTVILQAHMDMVCVARNGVPFEPTTDSIKVVNDGTCLSAEGTSLGADDGIGIAIILYLLGNQHLTHGPLRALFTTSEETNMAGMGHLDARHLAGNFLINVDGEEAGSLCNSSADATLYSFTRPAVWKPLHDERALTLRVDGLRGGHSGMNIHEGRGNALRLLGFALASLTGQNIPVRIAALQGGIAQNAIPSHAEITLVCPAASVDIAKKLVQRYFADTHDALRHTEHGLKLTCTPASLPAKALDSDLSVEVVSFMCLAHSGVYTMSPLMPGHVESSANLGVMELDEQQVRAQIFARSSSNTLSRELAVLYEMLAASTGFSCIVGHHAPGWPVNPDSALTRLASAAYHSVTGQTLRIVPVHAGLECGYCLDKNPRLDVISVGPQVDNVHSPAETLHLNTLPDVVHMLEILLEKLALRPWGRSGASPPKKHRCALKPHDAQGVQGHDAQNPGCMKHGGGE